MTQHEWSDCDDDFYSYCSSSEDDDVVISQEEWEDWNSEELLNMWMSIVESHEDWYLPLPGTFHDFCDFMYQQTFNFFL